MAHTKAGGSTKNSRESRSQRLGVKLFDGQAAKAGQIIIRQRGTKYIPGNNVKRGSDDTLYAKVAGVVKFLSRKKVKFDGTQRSTKIVRVEAAK